MASQLAEARQLGQHLQANVLHYVEQLLLVDFPLRAGSAADSLDLSLGFKLDEVTVSLKVSSATCTLTPFQSICTQLWVGSQI